MVRDEKVEAKGTNKSLQREHNEGGYANLFVLILPLLIISINVLVLTGITPIWSNMQAYIVICSQIMAIIFAFISTEIEFKKKIEQMCEEPKYKTVKLIKTDIFGDKCLFTPIIWVFFAFVFYNLVRMINECIVPNIVPIGIWTGIIVASIAGIVLISMSIKFVANKWIDANYVKAKEIYNSKKRK